jgi:hypothetical protein
MKKLISIMALALGLAGGLHAQPTYDGSTKSDNAATFAFNNTGSANTMLVVGVFTDGAQLGSVETVEYNGVAMNQGIAQSTNTGVVYWFYLASPASGSNTVAVTFLVGPTDFHVVAAAYDACYGIGQSNGGSGFNASMTFGAINSGNLAVYLGGSVGVSPSITQTTMTTRQSGSNTVAAYAFGETLLTTPLTFTGAATGNYQLVGAQLELLTMSTPTPTSTPTASPTYTASGTPTSTPTASPSNTPTLTDTPTLTNSPTITATWTVSNTPISTSTFTASPTWSASPTPTSTFTASPTLTDTPTSTFTTSPTPTDTETATLTATGTLTATPTLTWTITKTDTISATPTVTWTSTFTASPTATPTMTDTPTSTPTPTSTSTFTVSPTPTWTPTTVPLPYDSYVQPVVPALQLLFTVSSLGSNAAWTFFPLTITARYSQVVVANPALTPGQALFYQPSLNSAATPATDGNPLLPGTSTNPALPGAAGMGLWVKAAVTAQAAAQVQVNQ